MDLRTLSYFVTVAEELNITRAAEKLNMSQPPLSSQIKNLEDELETVLFIRGKRHLTLTSSGQLLYRRAKEILNLSDKASAEIISMSKGMTGTIAIGLVEGMAPSITSKRIAGFLKEHPQIKFDIIDGNSDDIVEKLRSGIVSLAVISGPIDNSLLNSFLVGTEKVSAFINKDHPLANNGSKVITPKDLVGEPLIFTRKKSRIETLYKWFKPYNAEPNIVCRMDSFLDAVSMSAANLGISIFPKTTDTQMKNIVVKEIDAIETEINYYFVWRKGHPLPTIEESFIDYAKEYSLE